MNIGTLTVTLGVNAEALTVAATRMSEFAKKTNAVNQRIRTIGYLTSAVITAPMVAAGRASFNMAKEYEYSMQKIVGLTGTSQEVVDRWGDSIKAMAREFGKSPKEIADALYFIASSGIATSDALDVLRVSVKAAAAGLGQTSDVANYLTSVLNAYRGTGITAAYATDVLVAAVREGKAEADGFAAAMGGVIPIASKLGVSIDQVAGAMAAITLTGSTASQAGVYLKNIFNALYKEADKGQKAMTSASLALDGMNTSYADLRKILKDQGVMGLVEKIRILTSEYGETLVAQVFPEIRAMSGMMSLMGKNFAYNNSIMKEITESSGSLAVAFEKVSQTTKIRYDRALQSVNVSLIELGQTIAATLIPLLEKFAKWLDQLVDHFNSLTEEQKRFRLIMAAVVAATGPLLLLISSLGYGFTGLVSIGGRLLKVLAGLARGMGLTAISTAAAEAALAGTATAATAAATGTAAAGTAAASAGIAAGTAATSFLAFGAAMGVYGLAVWMVVENAIKPLIQKIKAMRDEYKETMALVEGTDAQMELDASISAKRFDIGKLSKETLEGLKVDIQQRLALEKEDLDNAKIVSEEKLKQEKEYQNKLEAIRQRQKDWEWVKETSYGGIDLKNAFFAYQEDMQKLEKDRDDFIKDSMQMAAQNKLDSEAIIGYYQGVAKEVDTALKKITDPIAQAEEELEKLKEQSEEVNTAFFDLMIGESAINRMLVLLGGSYDDLTEKTQLYKGILERLVEIETKAGHAIPWVTEKINDLVEKLAELERTKISRDLQNIAGLGNILGNSFSANAESADVLKQALIDFNINSRGTSGAFSAMGIQGQILQTILDGLITRWENYTIAATIEDTTKTVNYLKAQRDAFQTLESEIEVVSAELEGYKKYMEVLYATNRQGSAEWLIMADRIKEAQLALQSLQSEGRIAPLEAMVMTFGRFEDKIALATAQMDVAKDKMDLLVSQGKAFTEEYYKAADTWAYFKSMLATLQDTSAISFAKDMFLAFEDSSHYIDLINAKVEVLTNRMRDLAEMKNFGWQEEFKQIADEIDKLSMQANALTTLESAFTDLFTISKDKFEDFGGWMTDWLTSLGENLSRILAEFVAKKLVGTIAKALTGEGQDMAEVLTSIAFGKAKSYEALAIAVAEAAKMGYPALLVSIPSAVATVIGALGAGAASASAISGAATGPAGFKEGGIVPAGFPNDTFPAMLTSGEIILPPNKATEFADQIVNKKKKEKEAALKIPQMQNGGIIPAGYDNDTFHAMLSSGEAVIPLDKLEDILKRYPAVFKIIDTREKDLITGQPVSPYSKLHGTLDLSFVEEVVRKALERGIDPFTALAIPHQETGGTPSGSSNPYAVNYENPAQLEKLIADPIGASLDILQAKLKLADKLGYDTYAKMVQVYNGMGKLTQGAVGGGKAYGVEIPEEGIKMKENPLYGKRVEDVRNNILMQNDELVSFVESLMKGYSSPTLPSAIFAEQAAAPIPIEYAQPIPTDTASAISSANEALQQFILSMNTLSGTTIAGADAANTAIAVQTEGVGKYTQVANAGAQGISNVVGTAIQGGDVGKAMVGSLGALLPSLLSLIPGIGPILSMLLGGLGGGIFSSIASKMAKGGVVPSGYMNDTYPALLSSGETVLPREYKDMPDMLTHLTKQGSIPSGTISDELQLLLSTYEINFPEEKFKALFAPLMKRPIAAEKSLDTRKKFTSRIYNVNNYTNNLTKITKDQAVKNSAITKQLGKISKQVPTQTYKQMESLSKLRKENNMATSVRNMRVKDSSSNSIDRLTRVMKDNSPKTRIADRMTNGNIGNSQVLEKVVRMKRTNDKSLEYLTRISRGTEMTEKILAGADYFPSVAKMAGGGMVPPGYPNDSFPAFLSSGEHVLPNNIRTGIKNIEQRPQKIEVIIDGKISGKDLVLALRRANLMS